MSNFALPFGIYVAIVLFTTIRDIIQEAPDEFDFRLYGKPKWQNRVGEPVHTGTVMSEYAFQGEPWFTQANIYSFAMKGVLISVLIWYLGPQSEYLSAGMSIPE